MLKKYFRKGSEGIGTMIIFIALILVAVVGSAVIIQTSASLQSKSLDVGSQSREKITTDVEIMQISVRDTSDGIINGSVDNFTVIARLGIGSTPIKLSDMLIKLDSADNTQSMTYRIGATPSETRFDARYKINGSNNLVGYFTPGDVVEFTFVVRSGTIIPESSQGAIRIIPKNGVVKPADFTTPSSMVERITYLYP